MSTSTHAEDFIKDVEDAVLGACFDGRNSITIVLEKVSSEYFFSETHQEIMESVTRLYWGEKDVTIFNVARDLEENGKLGDVGGIEEIGRIKDCGEDALNQTTPRILAATLKDFYVRSQVSEIIEENKSNFSPDSEMTLKESLEIFQSEIQKRLLDVSETDDVSAASDFMAGYLDILDSRLEIAEKNKELSGGLQGIPTPLRSLNKYTSGFKPGQLITVGAQTGVGKSVFAVMQTVAALKAGKSVMFFSLEMSDEELFDRIVANVSHVKLNRLMNGDLDSEERERVASAADFLKKSSLIIDTDPRATVDSIRSKATKRQQSEEGLDLIVVDYLQLLSSSERFNSRQEQVADLSRNMKLTAKSLGVPVLTLTQLNRKQSESEDGMPTLDNIRESGAIAQDSDIVMLLHRNKDTEKVDEKTVFVLAKNRGGPSDKRIYCHTELAYSNFAEAQKSELVADDEGINSPSNTSEGGGTAPKNEMEEFFKSTGQGGEWDALDGDTDEDGLFDGF